jgi:predicted Zn finger-like uncharacterized protein
MTVMPIQTSCPHCDQTYSLADNLEGKKVRCKSCGKSFTVTGEAPQQAVRKPPSGARQAARAAPDAADDFAFEEEPGQVVRPPRSKKGGIPLWVWLVGGGGLFLFLCCGGGGIAGFFLLGGTDRFVNKVTKENFDKIKTGMTEAQVKEILGEPTETAGTPDQLPDIPGMPKMPRMPGGMRVNIMVWKKGDNTITVNFMNGKVVAKQGHFRQ